MYNGAPWQTFPANLQFFIMGEHGLCFMYIVFIRQFLLIFSGFLCFLVVFCGVKIYSFLCFVIFSNFLRFFMTLKFAHFCDLWFLVAFRQLKFGLFLVIFAFWHCRQKMIVLFYGKLLIGRKCVPRCSIMHYWRFLMGPSLPSTRARTLLMIPTCFCFLIIQIIWKM